MASPTNNAVNTSLSGQTGTGEFVGSNSPTIVTPIIDQINDNQSEPILTFSSAGAGSVNYLNIINNTTTNPPALFSIGSDTDVGMVFQTKNSGVYSLNTLASVNAFTFATGTTYQHLTQFSFANTAVTRNVIWPDATGTVSLLGNSSTGTGAVVLQNSPTIVTPEIGQINDTNGIGALSINATPSAVNYFQISNSITGNNPVLVSIGSDTDIGMNLLTKGIGALNFQTMGSTSAITFSTGTSYQHVTAFTFANTANTRNVTWPDATGTVQLQSQPLITAPAASQSSALTLGAAFQNVLGYDVVLTVYLSITAATTADVLLGVGPTNAPTQQTIVSALTTAALAIVPVTIYLPNNYYALLSTSGTITLTITGQQAMPV